MVAGVPVHPTESGLRPTHPPLVSILICHPRVATESAWMDPTRTRPDPDTGVWGLSECHSVFLSESFHDRSADVSCSPAHAARARVDRRHARPARARPACHDDPGRRRDTEGAEDDPRASVGPDPTAAA